MIMRPTVLVLTVLASIPSVYAEPVVYTSRSEFLAALAAQGIDKVSESFENDTVWAASRNSIVAPGSTPLVTSKGIEWTSNHAGNEIATGDVGGSAPAGNFAIYSLPHGLTTDSGLYCDSAEDPDIPLECFQNDGLKIASATGQTLYAFGARIDTANSGKVTFLLDGVDINGNATDNIDNWQREGNFADSWSFVGVIDTEGFFSAELRELRGKDYQQVYLFADAFVVGVAKNDADGDGVPDDEDYYPDISLDGRQDTDGDGIPDECDAACQLTGMTADTDDDGDGFIDEIDNCPLVSNPGQEDVDDDGIGDACDLPPGC
ncbi:MAG: hypothetical protein Hals2KO_15900 [Halioglobus sp.]